MTQAGASRFQAMERGGELAAAPVRGRAARSLVDALGAPQVADAYRDAGLEIWLWNLDFDDRQRRIDVDHGLAQYRRGLDQVWLFH